MEIDRTVGFADYTQTEVVGPAGQHPVELFHHGLGIHSDSISSGLIADCTTDALHSFLRWHRAQVDPAPFHRVASPERIPEKVKLLLRQVADSRLLFTHRQPRHHHLHLRQSLLRPNSATDDKIIGIVHDVSFPTLLVPEFLPPQHEPSHVQVAEQRTDWRPLWRPPTFVPVARTSMFVPALVGLFYRSLQPHLNQMQHCSIDDPASYRLHQLGMWNAVEVTAEISINDLSMSGIDQLVNVLYGVQCAAICPIGILLRLQVGLENWFENQHRRRLRHPISDAGYP